jgi:hypothetical protein
MTGAKERVSRAGGKNRRYWIREIDEAGLFRPPPAPAPRDRYLERSAPVEAEPGAWGTQDVEILALDEPGADPAGARIAGCYRRNYPGRVPSEIFRQGDREYALISPHYTATSVMDLATGQVVATEKPSSGGFCPVGFYVPDWHDVHDGSILPGTTYWKDDNEWPRGDLGFVWGCQWGDDNSWKIQVLDLSRVAEGKIARDERFGYVELAARGLRPQEFIHCWPEGGDVTIRLAVENSFRLSDGRRTDWYAPGGAPADEPGTDATPE